MFRLIILLLGLALTSQSAIAQRAGVGAWENPDYTILKWIEKHPGLAWYYDWRTDQIESHHPVQRSVEFVPMIHSARNIGDRIRSSQNVRHLLAFNEPDGRGGKHQANMTVAQAIALWPRLEARGLRLGSPATTQAQTLGAGSWQRRFMSEADRRGLRVDFMAVHYYSKTGDVKAFRKWLIAVYREYKRPIWVSEFAFIDWSQPNKASYSANAAFAKSAISMMETLPFVERYAWFAANPYPWHGRSPAINLVDNQLRSTPVGRSYAQALEAQAFRRSAGLESSQSNTGSSSLSFSPSTQ